MKRRYLFILTLITIAVFILPPAAFAGMISYWQLDEGFGPTALDSVGGNDGSLVGPTWTSGKVDDALNFNSSDYVQVPNASELNPGQITLEAWVYPSNAGYYRAIVSKQPNVGFAYPWAVYSMGLQGNTLKPDFSISVGNTGYGILTENAIPENQWTHLAGTYDGETLSLYVDGLLVDTETAPSGPIDVSSKPVYIGHPPSNAYYTGKIDEVAIHDEALSADEIQQHYLTQLSGGSLFDVNNVTTGTPVTVDLWNGISVTFDNVTGSGNLTGEASSPGQPAPGSFRFLAGSHYEIQTTASYTGNILVTVPYNEEDVHGSEDNLKLFHWSGSGWEDVTVSVDTVNNTITGQVTSLSPFGVGEEEGGGSGGTRVPASSKTTLSVMAVLGLMGLGYFVNRAKLDN